MVTAASFCFLMKSETKKEPIMPQPETPAETPGLDSPEEDRVEDAQPAPLAPPPEGSDGGSSDSSETDGVTEPSNQEDPEDPPPAPVIRITIIPGRETDEDVEPGEEVPNVEVDVTTEPR